MWNVECGFPRLLVQEFYYNTRVLYTVSIRMQGNDVKYDVTVLILLRTTNGHTVLQSDWYGLTSFPCILIGFVLVACRHQCTVSLQTVFHKRSPNPHFGAPEFITSDTLLVV